MASEQRDSIARASRRDNDASSAGAGSWKHASEDAPSTRFLAGALLYLMQVVNAAQLSQCLHVSVSVNLGTAATLVPLPAAAQAAAAGQELRAKCSRMVKITSPYAVVSAT